MKILFSADEHLCLRRKGIPKEWEINRFKLYHEKIVNLINTRDIDVFIHGGDFFDREPNMEEIVLAMDEHFNKLPYSVGTLVIDGNHEAKRKGTSFLHTLGKLCKSNKVHFFDGLCTASEYGIDFLPYKDLKRFEAGEVTFEKKNRILVTHVRGEIPPHVKPEVDLNIFKDWDLVLAGDLHDRSNSQGNIMYPGSPMTTHAYRDSSVKKGVLIVDTETLEVEFVDLDLPKILRKTVTSSSQAVQNGIDHIDYEIVMPELLHEITLEEIPSVMVVSDKSRVDMLAEVLATNPLKDKVIEYYADLRKY